MVMPPLNTAAQYRLLQSEYKYEFLLGNVALLLSLGRQELEAAIKLRLDRHLVEKV